MRVSACLALLCAIVLPAGPMLAASARTPQPHPPHHHSPSSSAGQHKDIASPVAMHAPWTAGDTWQVITYFGTDSHTNLNNDYYAVDWKPVGESCHQVGDPILAPAAGTVTFELTTDGGIGSGGKQVWITFDDAPSVTVHFEHLDSVLVGLNAHVNPPDEIGTLGETGLAVDENCAHLEMGVRKYIQGVPYSIKPGPLDGQRVTPHAQITSHNG